MRKITKIIIHCSATPPDMDIGADVIRGWHVNDNKWRDIGYHLVVRRDGTVETGRPIEQTGAHCAAKNGNTASVGICMVGGVRRGLDKRGARTLLVENNFTAAQWASLKRLVRKLVTDYPGVDTILGHHDLDPGKACPSFSVKDWLVRNQVLAPTEWAGDESTPFANVVGRVTSTEEPA